MKDINLEIVIRDSKNYKIQVTRNNIAVNISGWSIYFTVKTDWNDDDSSSILSKNVLIPTNSDSQAGIAYLPLTSSDTNIAVGEYYYDIKLIDLNYRETFARGRLAIIPSIRKA